MAHSPDQIGLRWLLAASYASVVVAFLLIAAKLVAWFLTDSASMLGSLLDSVMDSMASLINMVAVRYSIKPADEDHRFGHGKAESLAGLVQSGFILASSILLLLHCAERLAGSGTHTVENPAIGIAVTIFALVSTLALVAVQSHAIRLTGSTAIRADSLHYKSDILLNLSVMAALAGAGWGLPLLDAVFGGGIAFFIAYGAVRIGWEAFDMLMDRELPPEVDREILALALKDVASKMGDKAKIIKIDVDKNPKISNKLGIRGVPTFVIYKKGKIVWRQSGMQSPSVLMSELEKAQ